MDAKTEGNFKAPLIRVHSRLFAVEFFPAPVSIRRTALVLQIRLTANGHEWTRKLKGIQMRFSFASIRVHSRVRTPFTAVAKNLRLPN